MVAAPKKGFIVVVPSTSKWVIFLDFRRIGSEEGDRLNEASSTYECLFISTTVQSTIDPLGAPPTDSLFILTMVVPTSGKPGIFAMI